MNKKSTFTFILFLYCLTPASLLYGYNSPTGEITFQPTREMRERVPELDRLLRLRVDIAITNDDFTIYESENPQVLQCDISAIGQLYQEEELYSGIRIIKMMIYNDTPVILDINRLASFEQLEYIQLIYKYDACGNGEENCLKEHAERMVLPGDRNITGLYQLQITR